ncbi:MAG TPA: restriction endonuclease [Longimicrobium sp.]|nr:restriction endonuclease [Longimicrobium sp.]
MIPADQLTRELIESLSEAELRERVLIPLFRAMGFKNVHHYHGGSGEQGKDIVMWRDDALGVTECYSVVVVTRPISGKAEGGGSTAAKVFFQIRQSLGSEVRNLLKLSKHRVDHCWVVTSKTVKKEARESLANALGDTGRVVRIIDGDELWSLVERFLKGHLIKARIDELHETLKSTNKNLEIVANVGGGEKQIVIRAKDGKPLHFKPIFNFPDTPEGREAKAAYEAHIRNGVPVVIPGDCIADIEISDDLAPLLAAFPLGALALGPQTTGMEVVCDVVCTSIDGSDSALRAVRLRVDHYGAETITISNAHQSVPWRVELVVPRNASSGIVNFTFAMEGSNAKQQLEMVDFQVTLSEADRISFIRCDDGTEFVSGRTPSGLIQRPNEDVRLLLSKLYSIQQRTGCVLSLPHEISNDEFERVLTVAEIVETGEFRIPGGAVLNLPATRQLAENLINLEPDPNSMMWFQGQEEQVWDLFGVAVPVGKAIARFWGGAIVSEDIKRVAAELRDPSHVGAYRIRYQLPKDSEIVFTYRKFASEEERDRLKIFDDLP